MFFDLKPAISPQCETCGDMGRVTVNVPVGHELFGRTIPCPEPDCKEGNRLRQLSHKRKFQSAGIPVRYQDLTFSSFQQVMKSYDHDGKQLAYGATSLFAKHPDHMFTLREAALYVDQEWFQPLHDYQTNILVLSGDVGQGKTGLMIAAANALMERGKAVLYIRVQDLIAEIQGTYRQDTHATRHGDADATPDNTSEKYYTIITSPVLAMDEFNLENYTPDRLEIIEKIVRGRHSRNLPMIATTNLNLADFQVKWGKRIGDIMASGHWVTVSGVKLRQTTQQEVGF